MQTKCDGHEYNILLRSQPLIYCHILAQVSPAITFFAMITRFCVRVWSSKLDWTCSALLQLVERCRLRPMTYLLLVTELVTLLFHWLPNIHPNPWHWLGDLAASSHFEFISYVNLDIYEKLFKHWNTGYIFNNIRKSIWRLRKEKELERQEGFINFFNTVVLH